MSSVQVIHIDEACLFGLYQNVLLTAWWDTANLPKLRRLQETHKAFVESTSGPLVSLSLLHHTRPKPASKEERQLIGDIASYAKERFVGQMFFVKAGGLLTLSLRMILSGVKLLIRPQTQIEVYNDIQEAVRTTAKLARCPEEELLQAAQTLSIKP